MATGLIYKEGLKLTLFRWTKSHSHIPDFSNEWHDSYQVLYNSPPIQNNEGNWRKTIMQPFMTCFLEPFLTLCESLLVE